MNEKGTSWCAFKGQGLGGGVGVTCSWMGEVLGDRASAAARALEFKVWSSCKYLAVVVGDCCDDEKKKVLKYRKVTRPGIEPKTFWTYTRCSNQLSYLALEFSQLILYLCNCQPKDTYSARHIQCYSLHARSTLWPWHDQISQSGNHVTDYNSNKRKVRKKCPWEQQSGRIVTTKVVVHGKERLAWARMDAFWD